MGFKCICNSDLEKSLGGMQRDLASTVHSSQHPAIHPAHCSNCLFAIKEVKSNFLLLLFCSPVTRVSAEPHGAPWKPGNWLYSAPQESSVNSTVTAGTETPPPAPLPRYIHPAAQPNALQPARGLRGSNTQLWESPSKTKCSGCPQFSVSRILHFPAMISAGFADWATPEPVRLPLHHRPKAQQLHIPLCMTELLVAVKSPSSSLLAPMSL